MKKLLVIATLFFFTVNVHAQKQDTPEAQVAHKMADKMADSLGLTKQQRAKLFSINMEIARKKTEARKKSTDRTVVQKELQKIENSRDSLYKQVLTIEQHSSYLKRKRNVINNN